jgi:hypothetical protein
MMSRTGLILVVVALLLVTLPVFAQAPAGGQGGQGGQGGRGGGRMGGMMGGGGPMSIPPVMTVTDKFIYVIYLGQLSQIDANTLTVIKTVPLPMPEWLQRMMQGGGQPGGGGGAPAGGPAAPPPAAPG